LVFVSVKKKKERGGLTPLPTKYSLHFTLPIHLADRRKRGGKIGEKKPAKLINPQPRPRRMFLPSRPPNGKRRGEGEQALAPSLCGQDLRG